MGPEVDEQLIGALYGTAVETGDWRPALERCCKLLNSCEASWSIFIGRSQVHTLESTGRILTQEAFRRYAEYYGRVDPKLHIFARQQPGYLFNDACHFDEQFVAHDVFYQEYSRSLGTRHTLDMLVRREAGRGLYVAAMRPKQAGPYDARSEILFRQASGHFARALAIKEKMDCLRHAGDTLDRLDFGVIIVDSFYRVRLLNRPAEERLAKEGELRMSGGILFARSSDGNRRLKALIDAALQGRVESGVLEITDADATLTIRVCPLPAASRIATQRGPTALILIGGGKRRASRTDLAALYDLTEAESRVALAIAEGRTLAAIAALHGVKYSTVRSQLLSVMEKMGVHRQADVARVLASI
jgi:DNA-binding CsgD family transcriptional regulator